MNITINKARKTIQRGKYNGHMPFLPYEERLGSYQFIRQEFRPGIGQVALFYNGEYVEEKVVKPTENYTHCSRLIDKIFKEKCRRVTPVIDKQNITKHVA